MANTEWYRNWDGDSAQASSVSGDNRLESDKMGVCLPYIQCLETVLNPLFPGIVRMSCLGRSKTYSSPAGAGFSVPGQRPLWAKVVI